VNMFGIMQALVSFVQDDRNNLRYGETLTGEDCHPCSTGGSWVPSPSPTTYPSPTTRERFSSFGAHSALSCTVYFCFGVAELAELTVVESSPQN